MKIIKIIGLILISVMFIIITNYFDLKQIYLGSKLSNLVVGVVVPYVIRSIIDLTDNESWKSSQRKLMRAGILQKDTFIRVSFAYLFRIKVDGKYFLVQNTRTRKYQPVGGTYKFSEDEADYLKSNFSVESDDRIPVDQITKRDYRLLVKNKELRNFVRRFNKTRYRENISNLSREFSEEIFSTGILDKNEFGELSYKYCGRHMTNVEYSSVFKHYELLLADVIEVKLSETQEQLFKSLIGKDCEKYRFATADEIKSFGVSFGTSDLTDNIANHTPKILNENTDKLIIRNKQNNTITIRL